MSGYIFTKDPYEDEDDNPIIKRDGDWAFTKWEEGKGYKCLFYKEKDSYSVAKYSDLGKKQYNYNKKRVKNLKTQVQIWIYAHIIHQMKELLI